ncbi:odorant receptor 43a-like [Schistocerca gregaria]|uniref:odorant receptor 43a-like n=1 Tax=Schistocerca gregaria TaxID=7010 RepID=UPI00211DC8AF|nr:odorant receptor 43a-like [Schistocerca gregaria]
MADRSAGAPLTWRSSADSVLRPNIRLLCTLGLWQPADSALFHAYTVAVLAVGVAHIAVAAVGIWYRPGDLAEVTIGLANVFVIFTALSKSLLFVSRRPLFYALARRVDLMTVEQQAFCTSDPTLQHAVSIARRRAGRLSVFFHWYVLVADILWSLIPLVQASKEKRWPFQQMPLGTWERSPFYELSYLLQCASTVFFSLISVDVDCFFVAVMIHITVQLRILTSRFATIGTGMNVTVNELDCQASRLKDAIHEQLRACVETHQNLLRLVSFLNVVMSPVAMLQLAVGAVSSCMVLFPATYSTDNAAAMKCWAALPVLGIQLYLYCSTAHHLKDQGEAVSSAVYCCAWPESGCRLQRSLLLVMCRAQRPLVLTAGLMFPINRATFLSLVNATYSYYTVLKHVNNR